MCEAFCDPWRFLPWGGRAHSHPTASAARNPSLWFRAQHLLRLLGPLLQQQLCGHRQLGRSVGGKRRCDSGRRPPAPCGRSRRRWAYRPLQRNYQLVRGRSGQHLQHRRLRVAQAAAPCLLADNATASCRCSALSKRPRDRSNPANAVAAATAPDGAWGQGDAWRGPLSGGSKSRAGAGGCCCSCCCSRGAGGDGDHGTLRSPGRPCPHRGIQPRQPQPDAVHPKRGVPPRHEWERGRGRGGGGGGGGRCPGACVGGRQ